MAFIFKIYLSRTLGAEVIGLYHIALSVYGLLTCITASGIPLTLSRKTSEYTVRGKEREIFSIIASSMIVGISCSIFIILAIFIFRGNLHFIFKDIRAIPIFMIMLPALISTTVYSILRGWFWGKKDFKSFSFGEFIEEVFRVIFTVLLAGGIISGLKGEIGLAIAFTVSDVFCAVVMLYMFRKKGGRLFKPREYKALVKSSSPITLMRITTGVVSSLTAIIIPIKLATYGMSVHDATAAFGRVIGLAFPVIMIPLSLTSSITIVLIPEVSGQNAIGNMRGIAGKIDKAISVSVAITGLFLGAFVFFGREIGIILFNDVIAGDFIKAGAWMMILICICQITSSVLNSLAMEMTSFLNFLLGTVVMVFMIYFLPKYIGIYALILAYGSYYLICLIFNVQSLNKKKVLDLKFIKHCVLIVIFAIPAAYISRTVFELIPYSVPMIISTFISLGFMSAVYLVLLLVSGLIDIKVLFIKGMKTSIYR
jgi:stage V sporulation protein B